MSEPVLVIGLRKSNPNWRLRIRDAREAGERLKLDWGKERFTARALLRGMRVEMEHVGGDTGVPDSKIEVAKIALAHLRERPDYYAELAKIEKSNPNWPSQPRDRGGKWTGLAQHGSDVDDLPETEYFRSPDGDRLLPPLPTELVDVLGKTPKPLLLKRNIVEKNNRHHPELAPDDAATILGDALYRPSLAVQSRPKTKPDYWVLIAKGPKHRLSVVEMSANKDNHEVVNWYYVHQTGLDKVIRRAEREGGQFLITKGIAQGAADLSALTLNHIHDIPLIGQSQTHCCKSESSHKLHYQTDFQGIKISVENRKGSIRRGVDKDGHEWENKMDYAYGRIPYSEGTDGEAVDVYIGPAKKSTKVFVVHQRDPKTGKYDEDKVLLGFRSLAGARRAYLKQYDNPKFLGPITEMSIAEFREKLRERKGEMLKSQLSFDFHLQGGSGSSHRGSKRRPGRRPKSQPAHARKERRQPPSLEATTRDGRLRIKTHNTNDALRRILIDSDFDLRAEDGGLYWWADDTPANRALVARYAPQPVEPQQARPIPTGPGTSRENGFLDEEGRSYYINPTRGGSEVKWFTVRTKLTSDAPERVVSPSLPMRGDPADAHEDLVAYADARGLKPCALPPRQAITSSRKCTPTQI